MIGGWRRGFGVGVDGFDGEALLVRGCYLVEDFCEGDFEGLDSAGV